MGLVIGYDLCEDYVRISYEQLENKEMVDVSFVEGSQVESIAFLLCKKKGKEEWLIGEAAMEEALMGSGILVDKLKELVCGQKSTIIEGNCYTGTFLLSLFLQKTFTYVQDKSGERHLEAIVFTVPDIISGWKEGIESSMEFLEIPREKVSIISHSESFLNYLLNQSRNLWNGISGLFDITRAGFFYYEIKVHRESRPVIVETSRVALQEIFELDILKTKSGGKTADSVMLAGAEQVIKNPVMASIFLTGEGMAHCQEWAFDFLRCICNRRKVFYHHNLFARGALYYMHGILDPSSKFPCICVGEGRIPYEITMDVVQFGVRKTILLNRAGTSWYDAGNRVSFFPEDENSVKLQVKRMGNKQVTQLEIPLEGFPERPPRTTRVEMEMKFISETEMRIILRDRGFGELFPETNCRVEKIFTL